MVTLVKNLPVTMGRIGLRDTFGESGSPEALFKRYGRAVDDIVTAAKRVIERKEKRGETHNSRR